MESELEKKLDAAWGVIAARSRHTPRIAVILGSGLGEFEARVQGDEIPFRSLPGFPVPTVKGHTGRFRIGASVAVMAGRIHYYEGHPIQDVILPVFLLHRLGVRTLIVTNAAGGVNRGLSVGELVLIRDHINLMGVNPLRGPTPGQGPRFPDMTTAYDPGLRELAHAVSEVPLNEGVYAGFSGPSYETPAEIRMLEVIGADLVGMSTVPEVIAASYLGIRVLGISCVTNMAAGILPQPLEHAEVIQAGKEAGPRFVRLLSGILARLESEPVAS
ncbi:MAG: purine-nucleoside phosphorylase [Spirochaetia bacterium]|jgi:purine-nucleoside phosphorylase